jgi:arylsulfatase A-like enzyme
MVDYGALEEEGQANDDFEVELNIGSATTERANRAINSKSNIAAAAIIAISTLTVLIVGNAGGYKLSGLKNLVPFFASESSTTTKPNFVFILADDLGYGSLSKEVTPFLQAMRKNGVILQNYYSQESCTPARAALMTGRYPLSVGWQYGDVKDSYDGGLSLNETTIAEVLKANGYVNYIFGKWNLGHESPRYLPTARGFDYFLGYLSSYSTYWSKSDPDHDEFIDFMYADKDCYYQYDYQDMNEYSTGLYRDKAVNRIQTHDFSKPIFLYIPFQAVHDPFADSAAGMPEGLTKDYIASDTYDYIVNSFEVRIV